MSRLKLLETSLGNPVTNARLFNQFRSPFYLCDRTQGPFTISHILRTKISTNLSHSIQPWWPTTYTTSKGHRKKKCHKCRKLRPLNRGRTSLATSKSPPKSLPKKSLTVICGALVVSRRLKFKRHHLKSTINRK